MGFTIDTLVPAEGRAEGIVSLAMVKVFCSVDAEDTEFGALFELLRDAAVATVEGATGKLLAVTPGLVWRGDFPSPYLARLQLARGPLVSVGAIGGIASDGSPVTLEADDYIVRMGGSWLAPHAAWPLGWRGGSVEIEFTAGFEQAPKPLVQAVLMLVAYWFANREAVVTGMIATELPMGLPMLCDQLRDVGSRWHAGPAETPCPPPVEGDRARPIRQRSKTGPTLARLWRRSSMAAVPNVGRPRWSRARRPRVSYASPARSRRQ